MSSKIDIYEYRDYLQQRYGEILYRVPIDTGGNCPHRNIDGTGGCTFCPEDGARAIQLGQVKDIREQIYTGVRFAQRRYKASAFMAYLQTYTSTFSSITTIQQQVDIILETEGVKAIAFGTRPDCLAPTIIEYLTELNKRIDVWIELGVQTCQDHTLQRINRGHDWQSSQEAIVKINKAGLSTAVHLILGLPGESVDDMRRTIETVCTLPVDAIKLHNLHIIEKTSLAKEYQAAPFPLYMEHEYCDLLLELLPYIPEHIPLIRLTTDTVQEKLIAPHWSMSKGQFRKHLSKQMRARGISQGIALRTESAPVKAAQLQETPTMAVTTDDGSVTFYNDTIKEHYHTLAGARSEAIQKYIVPGNLEARLQKGKVQLLDICFGLGYNSLLACETAMQKGGQLEILALEMDSTVVAKAALELQEKNTFFDWNKCLKILHETGHWEENGCKIQLLWGDARHTAKKLSTPFDLIWLDAFSTQRNSELWTVDFFNTLQPLLAEDGALLTYCAAIPVRSGFIQAGFVIGETDPFARERGGTICTNNKTLISRPIPDRDIFLINTNRGIPYKDPNGTRTNKEILRAREFEISDRKKEG
ncbi:MAG: radical SAM protein (TIGR01212 family) [Desulforhopalus sp.]|jgi:radical SAM protein (TIGR01212 family)